VPVFETEGAFGERLVHEGADLGQFHRLGHKVICPGLHGLHSHIHTPEAVIRMTCVSGWDAWISRKLHPTHAGHAQIGQYHVEVVFCEALQGDFRTRGRRHCVSFAG
jgi:hypothetical protein